MSGAAGQGGYDVMVLFLNMVQTVALAWVASCNRRRGKHEDGDGDGSAD